jgi:hypothetical protein
MTVGVAKYGSNIFKNIGYKPKKHFKSSLVYEWENGNRGGIKYGELALANKENIFCVREWFWWL